MQKNGKYPIEQRQLAVNALEKNEMDRKTTAHVFGMPYSTLCSIFTAASLNNGVVVDHPRGGAHHRKLTPEMHVQLETWLDEDCSLTNEELARCLHRRFNVDVSAETVRKVVKDFHFSITVVIKTFIFQ
jgi:transposase